MKLETVALSKTRVVTETLVKILNHVLLDKKTNRIIQNHDHHEQQNIFKSIIGKVRMVKKKSKRATRNKHDRSGSNNDDDDDDNNNNDVVAMGNSEPIKDSPVKKNLSASDPDVADEDGQFSKRIHKCY